MTGGEQAKTNRGAEKLLCDDGLTHRRTNKDATRYSSDDFVEVRGFAVEWEGRGPECLLHLIPVRESVSS